MLNKNMNTDNSIKRDLIFASIGVFLFYLILILANTIDGVFGLSAAYNLVDIASTFLKVVVSSALTWGIFRIAFKNTIGKDFGSVFDNGWGLMKPVEKARWIIGGFIVIFMAIIIGTSQ